MLKHFKYTKSDGATSERWVYQLHAPSDKLMGLDLTEFSEDEREEYLEKLELLFEDVKDAIKEMGLGGQYRQFFESGIEEIE